jgi:hypothetical protein
VLLPEAFDASRDQNSVILVDRQCFAASGASDVTQAVLDQVGGNFLEPGDLFAASVRDGAGQQWLLVSFHGDSSGLSTSPVVRGLDRACRGALRGHVLLAGLDANTLSHGGDEQRQGVAAFRRLLAAQRMVSVWDASDDPFVKTTCGARTSLQTQLNKAVSFHRRFSSASVSLKDWILCYAAQVDAIADPRRDNTGARRYAEGVALPTTAFPSDHAVVYATVRLRSRLEPLPDPEPLSVVPDCSTPLPPLLRGDSGGEATLFDYWGMGELPPALSQLVDESRPMPDAAGGACAPVDAAVPRDFPESTDGKCEGTRGRRRSSVERRLDAVWMDADRSVWILFSPRPLSAALCKPWFRALLMVMAIVSLLRAFASFSEFLQPEDNSTFTGLFFRFTPLSQRHAFVGSSAHGDFSICRMRPGSESKSSVLDLLEASSESMDDGIRWCTAPVQ